MLPDCISDYTKKHIRIDPALTMLFAIDAARAGDKLKALHWTKSLPALAVIRDFDGG